MSRERKSPEDTPTERAAFLVNSAALRIEEETRTLAKLTAKLRGLALIEPAELARLRAVEKAASMTVASTGFDNVSGAALSRLRDALVGEWKLEERGGT